MGNGRLFSAVFLLIGALTSVTSLPTSSQRFPIPSASGPESLAFDNDGNGPYTGVSDGRIIKWNATLNRWVDFAVTTLNRSGCEGSHNFTQTEVRCGRPLGLRFDKKTGQLYIADAYMGLLVVGPNGGVATPIATEVDGIPFKFTNDLVIDQTTKVIYFTESSTRIQNKDYMDIISTGDNTGRLLMYDLEKKKVTVLADGLMFPNGVTLSKNGDFLLVMETTNGRVSKYWLKSQESRGRLEIFTQVPGNPDNIRTNKNGDFWVATNAISRGSTNYSGLGMAARLNVKGEIVQFLQDKKGEIWRYASEVDEEGGSLWIGSAVESAVVKLNF